MKLFDGCLDTLRDQKQTINIETKEHTTSTNMSHDK
jgi:hypothetical protein